MTAAIDLATVFLIFFGWFAVSFFAAVAIGRLIRGPQEIETHSRPRLGIPEPTSISEYVAQQDAKVARAKLAQAKRWGDAA